MAVEFLTTGRNVRPKVGGGLVAYFPKGGDNTRIELKKQAVGANLKQIDLSLSFSLKTKIDTEFHSGQPILLLYNPAQ